MKEILLIPAEPRFNYINVTVNDFPGGPGTEPRYRCTITVEYYRYDVEQLKSQGLDFEGAMAYYRDWIYNQIKTRILYEWTAVGGLEETLAAVSEKIRPFF